MHCSHSARCTLTSSPHEMDWITIDLLEKVRSVFSQSGDEAVQLNTSDKSLSLQLTRHTPLEGLPTRGAWPPFASVPVSCAGEVDRERLDTCAASAAVVYNHLQSIYMPLRMSVLTLKEAGSTQKSAGTGARPRQGRQWQRRPQWQHLWPWWCLQ